MFIKANTLKRLCKQAYGNGMLSIANVNGYYAIMGAAWRIEVKKEFLNKKAMAGLIEIVGPLPAEGEAFKYHKNEDPQAEILETVYIDLQAMAEEKSYRELKPTRILVETNGCVERMVQDMDGTKYYINEAFFLAPSGAEVEFDNGETNEDVNPLLMENKYTVIWKNNVMAFSCNTRTVRYRKEKQLLEEMDGKDMYWEYIEEEEL